MKGNRKRRVQYLLAFLLFAAALAFLGYPYVSDWICRYAAGQEIANYKTAVAKEDAQRLEELLQEAVRYNSRLSGGAASTPVENGPDTDMGAVSVSDYNSLLAVTDAIGYLEIPKLGIYLPIYHGVEEEVLQRGIGHMPDTSLPVGGASSHCVLSGHTGLPSAKLLTDLDQMEQGDLFYIHVLNEVLAYEVDQIRVVLPSDTSELQIEDGKDYVTLLTCTPYGVNSHRLLVRGSRTEYEQQQETTADAVPPEQGKRVWTLRQLLHGLAAAAGLAVIAAICLILFLPDRKNREKKE